MKRILFFFIAVLFVSTISAEIIKKPIITLEVAKKMAESCLNLAKGDNKKINIAIYESPGSLKYYASMDGTYPASEEISVGVLNTAIESSTIIPMFLNLGSLPSAI